MSSRLASISNLALLLRDPAHTARDFARRQFSARLLWRNVVIPGVSIRAVAILLRAMVLHFVGTGIVLALGSVLLQVGTWVGMSFVIPHLGRSLAVSVDERDAAPLATALCAPLWLAGVLWVFPEDPPAVLFVTRTLAALVAAWGLYVFDHLVGTRPVAPTARRLLVIGAAGTYLVVYLTLFTFVGITAHVVLYLAE